ncbi:hypothetical protein [Endozoicomonas sp. SCSIO W0465]|uniref:DUF6890 family protein n=1 Tax=Endozoicomonas sp. SCSIO W0465 TaxID=2918516 RepID=UPI003531B3E2
MQRRAHEIDQDGLTQLATLAGHWLPNFPPDEETMARALWLEKEYWQRMRVCVANGVARAFSGKKR